MNLPVPPEYLALALAKQKKVGKITLRHRHITDLHLPTGKLIATDAFVFTEPKPFKMTLPRGTFPVILSVTQFAKDQRVAFASIRFRDTTPVDWKMLTLAGQDTDRLEKGDIFGYGVDSGTGCFIDASAAKVLARKMADFFDSSGHVLLDMAAGRLPEKPEAQLGLFQEMMAAMDRTYVHTWSWLDMPFGTGNLVAFSSGFGDGGYATYAGYDADGEISVVVTDFSIVPLETK